MYLQNTLAIIQARKTISEMLMTIQLIDTLVHEEIVSNNGSEEREMFALNAG